MRTIMVGIYLLLYTIISIPLFLIFFLVGLINGRAKAVCSQKVVCNLGFRPLLFLSGVRVTVKGRENVLKGESALYVFNHRGFFDILAGYTTGPYPLAYVSKKEIGRIPMVSLWMKYMNCLFLDRSDIKKGMQTIQEGIELLKNGTSVYIAPEGTRNKNENPEELLPFHEASFRLALKSNRPVIPVALNNTDSALEKHIPWVHRAHIIIEYCEPIDVTQLERTEQKKLGQRVRGILAEKVKENQREVKF
ncbi:MAG: 1-acyl-sn-glycerol-3-phosphate acyltransferase [Lachnospiraceae bacterium]|nr:1-acyl-sn-glycerol-3-phosphate acyltransferase [Lachnospiraceae bacterium]